MYIATLALPFCRLHRTVKTVRPHAGRLEALLMCNSSCSTYPTEQVLAQAHGLEAPNLWLCGRLHDLLAAVVRSLKLKKRCRGGRSDSILYIRTKPPPEPQPLLGPRHEQAQGWVRDKPQEKSTMLRTTFVGVGATAAACRNSSARRATTSLRGLGDLRRASSSLLLDCGGGPRRRWLSQEAEEKVRWRARERSCKGFLRSFVWSPQSSRAVKGLVLGLSCACCTRSNVWLCQPTKTRRHDHGGRTYIAVVCNATNRESVGLNFCLCGGEGICSSHAAACRRSTRPLPLSSHTPPAFECSNGAAKTASFI